MEARKIEFGLGAAASSISRPVTAEALRAIEESSLIRTLETNPCNFRLPGAVSHGEFCSAMKRRKVECPTYHASFGTESDLSSCDGGMRRQAVGNLLREFVEAEILGARIIVLHPSYEPIGPEERPGRLDSLRLSLSEIEDRVKKFGYRIALELLPRSCLGNTPEELLSIVRDFGDEFGFCLDVNHLTGCSGRLPEAVRMLADRLYALHISDYGGGDEEHLLPGMGIVDWEAFAIELERARYNGPFTYEIRFPSGLDSPKSRVAAMEENFKSIFGRQPA